MATYNLSNLGYATVDRKKVSVSISISAQEFFDRFSVYEDLLSSKSKQAIEDSINNNGKEEKIKNADEVEEFFSKVQQALEEEAAAETAESYEEETTEEPQETSNTSENYEEASEESSAPESESVSSLEDAEGEKVPIAVTETIEAKYLFNYLAPKDESKSESEESESEESESEESESESESDEQKDEEEKEELPEGYGILTRTGLISIKNLSTEQRIWDIRGKFTHNGAIEELVEEFAIQELNAEAEQTYEYQLKADKQPAIAVEEFISTINNPDTQTYSLNINQDNVVLFRLSLVNQEEFPVKNIVVRKSLPEGHSNFEEKAVSAGSTEIEEGQLVWTVEEIPVGETAQLEFTVTVFIDDKDQKVRSGGLEVEYEADYSLSGLAVEEFEAYGDNKVLILDEQLDDEPDFYEGYLEFRNLSPYITQLKHVSVKESESDEELITLEENQEIFVSAGKNWVSNTWKINTEGEIPSYTKQAEFILLPELLSTLSTKIAIDDIEMAVAIFEAGIEYDISAIPSNREVPFNATNTLTNGGAAPFDYLSITHVVPEHFKPPTKDEIKLTIDGEEYPLDPEWITISPDDQESTSEHEIRVVLDDLRLTELGMLEPNQKLQLSYPLIADNLSKDEVLVTNAEWVANTYPRGEPIVIKEEGEEAAKIEVVHERIKLLRGKSVLATSDPQVFDVVLEVTNNSNFDLNDYTLKDRVPDHFDAVDVVPEPIEHSEHDGKEVLVWKIESLPVGETFEIKYQIKATDDEARASEAQFSM